MGFLSRASVIYHHSSMIKLKVGLKEQHLQLPEAHHLNVQFGWACLFDPVGWAPCRPARVRF